MQVNYSSLKLRSLLLVSSPPVNGDSSNRNDWLVDFPLPEEGGYSLSLSGNVPQPDFRRGPEVYIPSPYGEHASETDVLSVPNLTILLFKRVPYHFRCGHRKHAMVIHKFFFIWGSQCISSLRIGALLLPPNPYNFYNRLFSKSK